MLEEMEQSAIVPEWVPYKSHALEFEELAATDPITVENAIIES